MFVTAFYAGKSKHSAKEYKKWIASLSNVITHNLYIFCNIEGYELIHPKLLKFVKVVNDVFDLEKIREYKELYKEMWKIDKERNIHNYRLYAIWNGKISMLKYVTDHVNSKIYIWIDIGSNRENKKYVVFPSMKNIKYLQKITNNNYMFFFQLNDFSKADNNSFNILTKLYIQGGTFGGSKSAITNYFNQYFSFHDIFLKLHKFVGKEQEIISTLAYYNLSKVILIKYHTIKI